MIVNALINALRIGLGIYGAAQPLLSTISGFFSSRVGEDNPYAIAREVGMNLDPRSSEQKDILLKLANNINKQSELEKILQSVSNTSTRGYDGKYQ